MRRRVVLGALLQIVLASLTPARGQHTEPASRIGILADLRSMPVERLRQKLRELGWIEGENLRFEYRFMEGQHAQYPTLAAELVALKVDVNVVWGTPAAVAAKSATGMIPVVVGVMGDVLSTGFVSNVARPGGNIIGSPA